MARWNREESILAFALYCETPFGRIYAKNPDVIALADKIGRTPAAVSMKMCNFARFDPALQTRGVRGLKNGSKLDEIIWDEFHADWETLINERDIILNGLAARPESAGRISLPDGNERVEQVRIRVNQDFFRRTLLAAYGGACCITGINVPDLLIASHIKPWRVSDPKRERTSPTNGLLLNSFHDRAFDKGLMTIDNRYIIHISPRIPELAPSGKTEEWLGAWEGVSIRMPEKFLPEKAFIEYHNDVIFQR